MDILTQYCNENLTFETSSTTEIFMNQKVQQNTNIKSELLDILKNTKIRSVFQPIISLKDAKVLGYETLSRGPEGHLLENPGNLFDFARIYGKLWDLESLCRVKALERISKFKGNYKFFINVDPDIINDEKFRKGFTKEFLEKFNISPENIVFEITEENSIRDFSSFRKVIDNYKDQGYEIAIDDTGSGYSGLKLITEIHPHYIKLDMNLIRNIDKDGLKYALIKTFHDFCQVTDIKLIAEGIETENELNTLTEIGIDFGQGFLIQRPNKDLLQPSHHINQLISIQNTKNNSFKSGSVSSVFVGYICKCNMTITPNSTGAQVLDIFTNNPFIYALPVVENEKVVGLVMKDKFYAKLGTQYGFALFLNRSIQLLMDKNPLIVDYETKIDIVSKLAMTRLDEYLYDYIIVTKNSNYHGILTVKDLLEKSTQLEVNYAKHLNPLSGLPGNIIIENKLSYYVANDFPFTVLYIDIDNFKVYNDVYGFENGDKMIQKLSGIITQCVENNCIYNSFTGHIGGDDFVIGVEGYNIEDICESIINEFEISKKDFYSSDDLSRGYVIAKNRHGIEEKFNPVTLSISGISNKNNSFKDIYELAESAGKLKKKCKEVWDNYYCIE